MDFDDSPEELAFRAECVNWLSANASIRPDGAAEVWKSYRPRSEDEDRAGFAAAKRWQATKAAAGYAGMTWPERFGGRGLPHRLDGIFRAEESRYDVPANAFQVGVDMVGPTLIAHGSEVHQRQHLDHIRRGERVWCQLFSEPGAGSDLAGLSTRGEVDGEEMLVNGQKVWTSGAHSSDWAILLVRTNPDARKHKGITYVLVDMRTPGIEVRPLRQIDGAVHFNEVFLTDVRIPLSNVVGDLNEGWQVTMTTLTAERTAIGGGGMVQMNEVRMLARQMGVDQDPVIRQGLARMASLYEITRYLGFRVQTAASQGRTPGPESSIMKLHISRLYAEAGDLYQQMMGAAGMLWHDDAPYGGFFQGVFLAQWAPRIGGGTDQIQRNVVGERVLGLPGEIRSDKDVPFRDLARR